ncbi:hypothetical protein KFZ70_14865 [Tamlana fucoidanivorans]|uniref:hypothetical protein n=1 Tax=Allotamlana fucoidanivorans TaxID=2583814 RepID=UPI0018EE6D52|nr:hypothetical protein [Tamlana fucoidanivorans]
MSKMEQAFYQFKLGHDYPFPIIDLEAARKTASNTFWNLRKHTLNRSVTNSKSIK